MDVEMLEMKMPLASKRVKVRGSDMHYLEQGEGNPILFLHGMPTSSYVWRNIMPALSNHGRCIAPDLIGMGKSDKPDIDYRVFDHIAYIEDFIAALDLKNITLVLHGWGSVIGFDYACRHENNISGLAFFESHIRPTTDWDMLSLPVQQMASLLKRPGASYRAIVQQNYLVKKLLPKGIIRNLTSEEMDEYLRPFPTPESRKPLWQYIEDLPLGKGADDIVELIARYSRWLQETEIAKLMLYAIPGFITTVATVQWARDNIKNLDLVGLDDVLHFAQESVPDLFSKHLRDWYPKSI
jgi:haloalkane dehalogenase